MSASRVSRTDAEYAVRVARVARFARHMAAAARDRALRGRGFVKSVEVEAPRTHHVHPKETEPLSRNPNHLSLHPILKINN